jgi:hypothetical protein
MYGGHVSNSQQVDRAIKRTFRSQGKGEKGLLPMSERIREVKPTTNNQQPTQVDDVDESDGADTPVVSQPDNTM